MSNRLKILLVLVSIFTALTLGTAGYMIIEEQSFSQSLYMTVITITSVGYGEMFELSPAGRLLTMVLCVVGLLVMVGSVTLLTSTLIEAQLPLIWQQNRMKRRINELDNHIIVCGAGDMAQVIVEELVNNDQPFVVIEEDPDVYEELLESHPDIAAYHGDATVDETLLEVGIEQARGLISTLPSDEENLFVCLAARELNRDLQIVTRIDEQSNRKRMRKAGADGVISPRVTGGRRMANLVLHPEILSFMDVIHDDQTGSYQLSRIPIRADSPFEGQTLAEASIPDKTGLIVISRLAEEADQPEFNPTSSTRLSAGDTLIVLGKPDQIDQLRELTHQSGSS
jgi:voltage-gated potassium channel